MKPLIDLVASKLEQAILAAFPDTSPEGVQVTQSTQEKFGHYQCNSAMRLAKVAGQPPRKVAEAIVAEVDADDDLIADLSIAGPGFINITLRTETIAAELATMVKDSRLGIAAPATPQRVVVDFSSPNTAKEMHVGHLRSTIIGDSIARTLEFLGHDVLRLNHIGDWGTAFGMLIAYMKTYEPSVLTGAQETTLTDLVGWYKASKKLFDDDPDFKKRSQLEVVALQNGAQDSFSAWEIICDISRKAYQQIYDILGVEIQERGESFYNPMLAATIEFLEGQGLVDVDSGAKCIFLDGFKNRDGDPLPLIIQKSDGGYNYASTDLAAIKQRIEEEKADRIIYLTDAGQAQHFKMIFQAMEKAGVIDPKKVEMNHVPFGLVLGPDGKKFKTRSGETVRLIDLLETAIDKASDIIDGRDLEISAQEKNDLAHRLGIGAVKYADLSCNRTGDYTFSYDRMLRFEGNTAAFLLYAYVRTSSIKRKVGVDTDTLNTINLDHPSEITLGLHLRQFSEALAKVSDELLPNRLTDYLYALAEKFNAFFRDCRVEGSEQQNERLLLCELTARVMKQGLTLLGLQTVEKM